MGGYPGPGLGLRRAWMDWWMDKVVDAEEMVKNVDMDGRLRMIEMFERTGVAEKGSSWIVPKSRLRRSWSSGGLMAFSANEISQDLGCGLRDWCEERCRGHGRGQIEG